MDDDMQTDLTPCPFPHAEGDSTETCMGDDGDGGGYHVECGVCGAEGPWCDTPEEAAGRWDTHNRRTDAIPEAARRVRDILGESNASDLADAVACGDMDAVEKVVRRMQEEGLG